MTYISKHTGKCERWAVEEVTGDIFSALMWLDKMTPLNDKERNDIESTRKHLEKAMTKMLPIERRMNGEDD
jgi:hypothetical protein